MTRVTRRSPLQVATAVVCALAVTAAGVFAGMLGDRFASVAGWAISAPAQTLFGRRIDQTGSFNLGLAVAGPLPPPPHH